MSSSTPSSRQQRRKSYSEKLKDQRWQKKRLELLEAADWKCQSPVCSNMEEKPTLHVHHKMYLRGVEPWDYENWVYMVVCEECHNAVQQITDGANEFLCKHFSALQALSWMRRFDGSAQYGLASVMHAIASLNEDCVLPTLWGIDGMLSAVNAAMTKPTQKPSTTTSEPQTGSERLNPERASKLIEEMRAAIGGGN